MQIPWNNSKEYYDIQSKDLFSHIDDLPFYHLSVVGNTPEEFIEYIIRESGIDSNSDVVDFGCGAGYVVNKLSQVCKIEGVSDSNECINQSRINFPYNTYILENMETYSGSNKTHCFFLESLFYSDIEKTIENCSRILKNGGIIFMKEWFDVSNNYQTTKNREYFENFFKYYPKKVSDVIDISTKFGFELISIKNLLNIINNEYWQKSLIYHHKCMMDYKEPYTGFPFIEPYQIVLKKVL